MEFHSEKKWTLRKQKGNYGKRQSMCSISISCCILRLPIRHIRYLLWLAPSFRLLLCWVLLKSFVFPQRLTHNEGANVKEISFTITLFLIFWPASEDFYALYVCIFSYHYSHPLLPTPNGIQLIHVHEHGLKI